MKISATKFYRTQPLAWLKIKSKTCRWNLINFKPKGSGSTKLSSLCKKALVQETRALEKLSNSKWLKSRSASRNKDNSKLSSSAERPKSELKTLRKIFISSLMKNSDGVRHLPNNRNNTIKTTLSMQDSRREQKHRLYRLPSRMAIIRMQATFPAT